MRMYCKNCGKKFYPTDDGWVDQTRNKYAQGYLANKRVASILLYD